MEDPSLYLKLEEPKGNAIFTVNCRLVDSTILCCLSVRKCMCLVH